MKANSWGDYRVSVHEDMAAHDSAPSWLRKVLNYAHCSYAAGPFVKGYDQICMARGIPTARKAVLKVVRKDTADDMRAAYGPDHPGALA